MSSKKHQKRNKYIAIMYQYNTKPTVRINYKLITITVFGIGGAILYLLSAINNSVTQSYPSLEDAKSSPSLGNINSYLPYLPLEDTTPYSSSEDFQNALSMEIANKIADKIDALTIEKIEQGIATLNEEIEKFAPEERDEVRKKIFSYLPPKISARIFYRALSIKEDSTLLFKFSPETSKLMFYKSSASVESAKVLIQLPQETLKKILDELSPSERNTILKKVINISSPDIVTQTFDQLTPPIAAQVFFTLSPKKQVEIMHVLSPTKISEVLATLSQVEVLVTLSQQEITKTFENIIKLPSSVQKFSKFKKELIITILNQDLLHPKLVLKIFNQLEQKVQVTILPELPAEIAFKMISWLPSIEKKSNMISSLPSETAAKILAKIPKTDARFQIFNKLHQETQIKILSKLPPEIAFEMISWLPSEIEILSKLEPQVLAEILSKFSAPSRIINKLHPKLTSKIIALWPPKTAYKILSQLSKQTKIQILEEIPSEAAAKILSQHLLIEEMVQTLPQLSPKVAAAIFSELSLEDEYQIFNKLSDTIKINILSELSPEKANIISIRLLSALEGKERKIFNKLADNEELIKALPKILPKLLPELASEVLNELDHTQTLTIFTEIPAETAAKILIFLPTTPLNKSVQTIPKLKPKVAARILAKLPPETEKNLKIFFNHH